MTSTLRENEYLHTPSWFNDLGISWEAVRLGIDLRRSLHREHAQGGTNDH